MVRLPNDPSRETFAHKVADKVAAGRTSEQARAAVATRHGFSGWDALAAYLDLADVYRRDNDPAVTTETIPDEFCRLACLTFTDDAPVRRAAARELRGVHPELSSDHIWAAAAAADSEAVRAIVAVHPDLANADGGPYAWKPLHYLTYSRASDATEDDTIRTARLLIDAGADVNAGYLWGGMPTPFTVLTGVFGEGEQGPGCTPRHPYEQALAELLLSAGADPNDGQTLYNRMFRPDNAHLELLFAHGLGSGDGGPWRALLGEAADTLQEMIDYQLNWAVGHGYADRVAMLLDHGANPHHQTLDGAPVVAVAAANGDRETVARLVYAGAEAPKLTGLDAFIADCLAGDADAVTRSSTEDLLRAALTDYPWLIARAVEVGRRNAIPVLVELGFDVNARRDGETALHRCAWSGDIPTADLLLDAGADPTIADESFGATPLEWAEHGCQEAFQEYLKKRL